MVSIHNARNDALPDEHEASLTTCKQVNAKPKGFARVEKLVADKFTNSLDTFVSAFSSYAATETKNCGKCNTCTKKGTKSLDLALV